MINERDSARRAARADGLPDAVARVVPRPIAARLMLQD
jgi:hypothetical protein